MLLLQVKKTLYGFKKSSKGTWQTKDIFAVYVHLRFDYGSTFYQMWNKAI